MKKLAITILTLLGITGVNDHAFGQTLEPGLRVRLYPVASRQDKPFVGTVESIDATRVVLLQSSSREPIEIPVDMISSYAVSLGHLRKPGAVADGIRKGLLIGTAFGIAGGIGFGEREGEYVRYIKRGVLSAGSVGALIGGIVGWDITERWTPVIPLQ